MPCQISTGPESLPLSRAHFRHTGDKLDDVPTIVHGDIEDENQRNGGKQTKEPPESVSPYRIFGALLPRSQKRGASISPALAVQMET
jgi:hypothetical protein